MSTTRTVIEIEDMDRYIKYDEDGVPIAIALREEEDRPPISDTVCSLVMILLLIGAHCR